MPVNGYRVSSGDNENVLKSNVMIVAQFGEHTKSELILHFKWVNCVVHELYLSNVAFL